MIKISKQKLLSVTIILTLLLISRTYAYFMPIAHAAEPNVQDKTMVVLNQIVGLNTESYVTSLSSQIDNQYFSLPQKEADFNLASSQGTVRVRCSFVNGNLRQIYLSDYEGELSVKQPAVATVNMAKGFLQRYQAYYGNSLYGDFASMLDTVNVNENTTKTLGNVMFQVSNLNQVIVDYVWTYIDENGVMATAKNVVLSYEQGQLKCFLNNWPLYTVVGTPNLSSEEAVAIALNASKNFSWNVNIDNGTVEVSGFQVKSVGEATMSYLNYGEQGSARGGDSFVLYPSWYVPLGFDKVYLGGVVGMAIRIWADTGEVSSMGPMVACGVQSTDEKLVSEAVNQEPATLLLVPIAIAVVIGTIGVSFGRKAGSSGLKKRLSGTLLCIFVLFSMFLTTLPRVNADYPYGKAMIYGSTFGQLTEEAGNASMVCNFTADLFSQNGYSTTNAFGADTTRSNVLSWTESMEAAYYRVAMFHFGHMAGPETGYIDNNNVTINHSDVYDRTYRGKHFFVWLWTCWQAESPYQWMPRAWTHGGLSSSDGYATPDYSSHCFIGFRYASPVISNATGSFKGFTYPASWFIMKFYYYALEEGYSVRDSLNIASGEFFNRPYSECPLYIGFETWIPDDPFYDVEWRNKWHNGTMRVFGNGNLKLYQSQLTLSARDENNDPLYPEFKIDNYILGTGNVRVAPGTHDFYVYPIAGYDFNNITFDYGSSSHTEYTRTVDDQPIPSDCVITAYFTYVEPTHQLTMLAINQYNQPGNVPLYIDYEYVGTTGHTYTVTEGDHTIGVASPVYGGDSYSVFVAYYYDGDYDQNNPTTLSVTGDKTVYACYWTYYC